MILCRGTCAIILGLVALVAILWTSPRNGMFNRAPLFFAGALTSLCAAVRLGQGQSQPVSSVSATLALVTPVETQRYCPVRGEGRSPHRATPGEPELSELAEERPDFLRSPAV
jgi:hypothetical protein